MRHVAQQTMMPFADSGNKVVEVQDCELDATLDELKRDGFWPVAAEYLSGTGWRITASKLSTAGAPDAPTPT